MAKKNEHNGIKDLYDLVVSRPIALLRMEKGELEALSNSRAGLTEFTLTASHAQLEGIQTPCPCLIFGAMEKGRDSKLKRVAYLAVMQSRSAVATLTSRMKFKRTTSVYPGSESSLLKLLGESRFASDFETRKKKGGRLSRLPPGLSAEVLRVLELDDRNHWPLRTVMMGLHKPRAGSRESQQYDAIQTALKAFGLPNDAIAAQLSVPKLSKSALGRARVMEDQIIEHDARYIPGYELADSVTGRATFRNGSQTLEVFTANRTNLEEAFGVDLIYLNTFQSSAVMIQYKMLEPESQDDDSDWVYSEDRHLQKQLLAMSKFEDNSDLRGSYRLCGDAFYFKFSRRMGTTPRSNVLLPLSHFKEILCDSTMQSRTGKLKLSYKALGGKYLRQDTFFGLLQAGYIGSYAEKTRHLKTLIDLVLAGNNSLVYALQRHTSEEESEFDRAQLLARIDREHQETFGEDPSDTF